MRLLFSLLLTTFFFIAPHQGDAKGVLGKEVKATFAKHFSQAEAASFLEYSHQTTISFQRTNVRSFSNQYRSVPGIHPGYSEPPSTVEALLNENCFLKSYPHFTPIAHKLIFPEHFFW